MLILLTESAATISYVAVIQSVSCKGLAFANNLFLCYLCPKGISVQRFTEYNPFLFNISTETLV